jgi:hypothetical protein
VPAIILLVRRRHVISLATVGDGFLDRHIVGLAAVGNGRHIVSLAAVGNGRHVVGLAAISDSFALVRSISLDTLSVIPGVGAAAAVATRIAMTAAVESLKYILAMCLLITSL